MSVLIVQLSDLHATTGAEPIFGLADVFQRAVSAELEENVEACVIIFNGDAAYGGRAEQFAIAARLINSLKEHLQKIRSGLAVYVLTVPGNHDCDLTSEDSEARMTLRRNVTSKVPSPSIARVLLEAQQEYFKFSEAVGVKDTAFSYDHPYFRSFDLALADGLLRINLLNTAWTSVLHDVDDLRFPLEVFAPRKTPEAQYVVSVMHHPVHWLLMPGVRRELRDRLESNTDLILTGHEHENEASRRSVLDGGEIAYIEGGVLSEADRPGLCTFNLIRLDFKSDKQIIKRVHFEKDHFEPNGSPEESSLQQNRLRTDRDFRLTVEFEQRLDELEDPLAHPRQEDLRLSHLFSYPDLRRITEISENKDVAGKQAELIDRIKSESVVSELAAQKRCFITGGDKAGKTSLIKRLFADFHRVGRVPILIEGSEIVRSGNTETFRKHVAKAVKKQYLFLSAAAFEQLPIEKKVIFIDDFQDGPPDPKARGRVLEYVNHNMGSSIIVANSDFYIEMISRRGAADMSSFLIYQRYEIADFGKQRFEDLAIRWTSLGREHNDPAELKNSALELCDKINSLISVAGLPQTPWLLAVILEHDESPDATIAAKNGDIGHLYHAVITVKLARSKFTRFNLNGKFTYLSELAYELYKLNRAVMRDSEVRAFHGAHAQRFDLSLDYEQVRDDLIDTRMLRLDGEEIAFRHKYVFAFFVAHWLARNIHKGEAQEVVRQLGDRLHHDVSANVFVFLAHLTDHPIVIDEMRAAAAKILPDAKPAEMKEELGVMNRLNGVDGIFSLPPTPPEANRKILQDAEDERLAKRFERENQDGRCIHPKPDEEPATEPADAHQSLRAIRASLRTIRILGQVLRNKALSTEAADKVVLMEAVLGLQRRVLGHLYGYLDQIDEILLYLRKRLMRPMVAARQDINRKAAAKVGDVPPDVAIGKLPRSELRQLWRDAQGLANRFWFDLYWTASFGVIKRVATAIGSRELDATMARIRLKDESIPVHLVDLASRLGRRAPQIPVDEVVTLHQKLDKDGHKVARVVLEAIAWERMLVFDTEAKQVDALCNEMGIKVPGKAYSPADKQFGPGKKAGWRS